MKQNHLVSVGIAFVVLTAAGSGGRHSHSRAFPGGDVAGGGLGSRVVATVGEVRPVRHHMVKRPEDR